MPRKPTTITPRQWAFDPSSRAGAGQTVDSDSMMRTVLLALLCLVGLLTACAPPAADQATPMVSAADGSTLRSVPPPAWAWPVEQWRNMDWDLWSCPRAKGC